MPVPWPLRGQATMLSDRMHMRLEAGTDDRLLAHLECVCISCVSYCQQFAHYIKSAGLLAIDRCAHGNLR